MRVTTSHLYYQTARDIVRQQGELAKTQDQIASGKRIGTPADDPVAAARSVEIGESIERLQQYEENAVFADQRLSLEDTTLDGATNLLQRVKELALAANSGPQTDLDRSAYRAEAEQRFQELLDYANTKSASGDYLFAGFKGNTRPFVFDGTAVNYHGDQGQQFLQVGSTRRVASGNSGYEVFQRIRNGNGAFAVGANTGNAGSGVIAVGNVVDATTYQPDTFTIRFTSTTTFDVVNDTTGTTILASQPYGDGDTITFNGLETSVSGTPLNGDEFTLEPSRSQDVFATLHNFIDALASNPVDDAGQAQLDQAMNGVINDLDRSLAHIVEVRTTVGARQNSIDAAGEENEAVRGQLVQTLSEVQDLDYAEAVSRLQFQLTTLQAVQQTFAQLQGLSLFSLLR